MEDFYAHSAKLFCNDAQIKKSINTKQRGELFCQGNQERK